jgi:hypothetical protein
MLSSKEVKFKMEINDQNWFQKLFIDECKPALKRHSGGGGSNEPNGKPIPVSTAEEMDSILANATDADVGEFYLYNGETTDTYTNGAVYSIQKEDA